MPNVKSLPTLLAEFEEEVLHIITDESEEGARKLFSLIDAAKKQYEAPLKSWVKYWVTAFSRTRVKDIEESIAAIESNPAYEVRLNQFKALISKGEWNIGSFNVYLFLELINTNPDFESIKEHVNLFSTLKDSIINKIDGCIFEFEAEQEAKKLRLEEIKVLKLSVQQRTDAVLIFDNLGEAQVQAKVQKDKAIFCLTKKGQWSLYLIDTQGKAYPLNLTEELSKNLNAKTIENVQELKSEHLNAVKKECNKAKELFLARIQLCVNPDQNNEELAKRGFCSAFVLRYPTEKAFLWWINSLGKSSQITVQDYPLLNTWLTEHPAPLKDEDVWELKLYLLNVKTSQTLNASRLSALDDLLAEKFSQNSENNDPERIKSEARAKALARMQLIINPEQDNANLSAQKICSTFILRHNGKKTTLWWLNSLSAISKIDLRDYPELNAWLRHHTVFLSKEDIAQLKCYLLNVNPSQALTTEKISTLNSLLAGKFNKVIQEDELESTRSATKFAVKISPVSTANLAPQKLAHARLSNLPNFWQHKQKRNDEESLPQLDIHHSIESQARN